MPSFEEVKAQISAALKAAGIEAREAEVETNWIVEHATGLSLAEQMVRCKDPVADDQLLVIADIVAGRERRVPLQYCMGSAYFMGLRLVVRPGVLIPRSDTETVVQVALSGLGDLARPKLADIGCGSGAIAIALLKAIPNAQVTAIDISADAVEVTRENALNHKVLDRLTILHGDWPEALPDNLQAIVANPPYVPASEHAKLPPEIGEHEPQQALIGQDDDGLGFYRKLSSAGAKHLAEGGFVALEIGDTQAEAVAAIFQHERWQAIRLHHDLNGLPRVVSADKPNS